MNEVGETSNTSPRGLTKLIMIRDYKFYYTYLMAIKYCSIHDYNNEEAKY